MKEERKWIFAKRGNRPSGPGGFTLVELLAVIAIVGVLACLAVPVLSNGVMEAHRAKCASNMRQIGLAMLLYANDHDGYLPPTTHSTAALGKQGRYASWIYLLSDYLDNIDRVRICPADNKERQRRILESDGLTSYVLNDLIFDSEEDPDLGTPAYNRLLRIPYPTRTMTMFNVSDDRTVNRGWDHAHCGEWTSWYGMLADVEVDRHRVGGRATDRLKGSANYLYLDGHVENITAKAMKKILDSGVNPGAIPLKQ